MKKTLLTISVSFFILVVLVTIGSFYLLQARQAPPSFLNKVSPTQEPTLTPINPKHCNSSDDCVTSCGSEVGRGDCYNKNYYPKDYDMYSDWKSPMDNTCCTCENCASCITCECINNTCTSKEADGDCC